MTRRGLDMMPDRVTIRHRRPATGERDVRRHGWRLAVGMVGSVVLFWVMVQLGQASTESRSTAPSSAGDVSSSVQVTMPDEPGKEKPPMTPATPKSPVDGQGPAIDTPREVLAMLALRKMDLDRREQAVRLAEERLVALKAEVETVLAQSEAARKQLDEARAKLDKQMADQKKQQDQAASDRKAKIEKEQQEQKSQGQAQLAKIYESMPAEESAARLEKMPERKAIEVLRILKGKTAGAILAQMKADRAAKLTEQLLVANP